MVWFLLLPASELNTTVRFWKAQKGSHQWHHTLYQQILSVTVSALHYSSHHCLSGCRLTWPFLWPIDVTQQSWCKRRQWQQSWLPWSERGSLVDCRVDALTFSEASPICFDVIVDIRFPGWTNCCSLEDWWLFDWSARSCWEVKESSSDISKLHCPEATALSADTTCQHSLY